MVSSELINLIEHGREERKIEYKSSMDWSSPLTKAKVAKSTMAMSNISGGGAIIFGIEEDSDGFHLVGMANGDFESFNQDDVMDHINGFADPYVELTLSPVKQQDGKYKSGNSKNYQWCVEKRDTKIFDRVRCTRDHEGNTRPPKSAAKRK